MSGIQNRVEATLALKESETFQDTSESWHISPTVMQQAFAAITGVGEPEDNDYYFSRGQWIAHALSQHLNLAPGFANKLAVLIERSALLAFGRDDAAWL